MKPLTVSKLLLAATAGAFTAASAQSLQDAGEHLDLDGEFVTYMNFEGDGSEIAVKLSALYEELLRANPGVPPIPVDFVQLFDTLGFGNVRAVGLSSKKAGDDGLVRNQWFTAIDGEPKGLLALYGLEPAPFRAAEKAPADASTVASFDLRFTALRDTLVGLIVQTMGPMGQGLAEQTLAGVLPGTDISYNELLEQLSGPVDIIMKQEFSMTAEPEFMLWLRFAGAGALLERLEPLAENMPISFSDTDEGRTADLSALVQTAGLQFFLRNPAGSNDLLLLTDPEWISDDTPAAGPLANTEVYQRVTAGLPETAAAFSYNSGIDLGNLLDIVRNQPDMEAYLPLIEKAIDLFLSDLIAPSASAYYQVDNGIVQTQYANLSYKEAVMLVPAAVTAGVGVAAAIQAQQSAHQMEEMDASWIEEAVQWNLAELAGAAEIYIEETGADEVTYLELQATGYIGEIDPVAGESYEVIVITPDTTEISVELPDGTVVSYAF